MYRLFYNYKISGDVLFVLIDPEKEVTRKERKGDVVALYSEDKLVGINIFNLLSIAKIKANGMIATPEDSLIDLINSILLNAGMEKLPYARESGYKVGKITKLEEHPINEKAHIVTISLGDKELTTVSYYKNLKEGMLVVVALEGTILYDGSVFHAFVSRNIPSECSILEAKELRINVESAGAFEVGEGYAPGDDFFYGGK